MDDLFLWFLQLFLACVNFAHAYFFFTWTDEKYLKLRGETHFQPSQLLSRESRYFIGMCEVFAGFCFLIPGIFGVLTWLTPMAAFGFLIVMISATVFHWVREEFDVAILCIFLGLVTGFVAYLRMVVVPL
eukprot:TRINITY_DN15528_c0_g1_i1.p1 TRINITY_DN15528_c0_g1~~TRINITY_DN15528_c0_g1_i1.p1  ORF type:complete len:130 (-),score=10.89 TRINITY_DN15528_c0_g1_i1:106-495(-)